MELLAELLAVADCACHSGREYTRVGVSRSLCPSPTSLDPSHLTVSVSSERLSRGKEEQVAEAVAEWALSGMEAADMAGGSPGRLFPEQESNDPDLRWKSASRLAPGRGRVCHPPESWYHWPETDLSFCG